MKTPERASKVLDMFTRRPPPPSMAAAFAWLDAEVDATQTDKLALADKQAHRTTCRLDLDFLTAPPFAVDFGI